MALGGRNRRGALATNSGAQKPMSWVAQLGLLFVVLTNVGLIAVLSDRLIDEAARGEPSDSTVRTPSRTAVRSTLPAIGRQLWT